MDFLAGFSVILADMCAIFYFSRFMFTMRINTQEDASGEILNEIVYYKNKMVFVFLFGSICFLFLALFGNLYNCIFLSWRARLSCVQQYIAFFVIFAFLDYFINRKEKYKVKKVKLSIKKDLFLMFSILIFCLVSTLVCALAIFL